MNRPLVLTLAATAVWALGAVWFYDCKIKRVCGPGEAVASPVAATAAQPAPASAPPDRAADTLPPARDSTVAPTPPTPAASTGVVLRVSFDARSAAVVPPADAAARLDAIKAAIAAGQELAVFGHSDGRGARARIAVVSQQRAEALRDWLLAQGVPANAITTVASREDREPIASNRDEDGRRLNRRAEAVLLPRPPES